MSDAAGLDHNRALVRRIVDEMFNRGNLEVAREIFAVDFVDRVTSKSPTRKMGPKALPNS
jgi:hypothetical protein